MSKIVFFCIPAWGHTNPTVEVVRELTRQGHQVRYYSFAPFQEKLEVAGADVVLCDGALPPAPADLDRKVGKDFTALVKMVTATTLALEEQICRELEAFRPDVIVSDSMCFWGKLFAGKMGVPYVCSTTTFAFNQYSAQRMKPTKGEMVRSLLGMPQVGRCMALLRRHGYPVHDLLDLIQNDNETDTIVYTSRAFQPMAETFSDRYAFVGPSISERDRKEQMPKDRPLVYISLGTVMNQQAEFYRACITALGKKPLDVVMSVGENIDPISFAPIPENFQIEHRVNQLEVLSKADVFLTHCGMNSANESIWYGVPTVLYPQQSEEGAVADRMEELGLGLRLKDQAHIREAVFQVLEEPEYRERTRRMGDTFRSAGGAEKAAEKILACCL